MEERICGLDLFCLKNIGQRLLTKVSRPLVTNAVAVVAAATATATAATGQVLESTQLVQLVPLMRAPLVPPTKFERAFLVTALLLLLLMRCLGTLLLNTQK